MNKLTVLGNVKWEFSIAEMNFKEEFFVIRNLLRELVFGCDFIVDRKVVIDGSADSVNFETGDSTFSPEELSRDLALYLGQDVVLESRSQHIIKVGFGSYERRLGFTQGMAAGRKIGQLRDRFVMLCGAVEMQDNQTRIVVTNLSSETILLKNGTAVVSFIPAVEITQENPSSADLDSRGVFFVQVEIPQTRKI